MLDPAVAPAGGGLSLRLTDCTAPFWASLPSLSDEAINWSKIPFAAIEAAGLGDPVWERAFLAEAERYLDAVATLGYTAITIDDLAHLVAHPWYPAALRQSLARWAHLYRRLFLMARDHGLGIFVTSDYCFFNPTIDARLRSIGETAEDFFAGTLEAGLDSWPEIDGIILRIGESDGVDVDGAFVSRLTLRRPAEARRLLMRLLPSLERRGKTLIFRTWTLGAYPIGDLIWNARTWDAVFGEIDSPALIVSLKYGDADFFRFLPLNPLFFHGPQRTLVELQCRREYEGMGEYPSFVGWLYEGYLRELAAGGANVIGVFAMQTGGWAPFQKVPFCGGGAFWNELNATAVAGLAQGQTVEESVRQFCRERGVEDAGKFLELLRLSDEAICDGLYIREFAERQHYFRRVRIPPLTWVFWHTVSTSGLIALAHRSQVQDLARAVAEGRRAVRTVEQMLLLARALGIDEVPLRFQRETFQLLALHREILLGVATAETRRQIAALLPGYRLRYPRGYRFDDHEQSLRSPHPAELAMRVLLRSRTDYRWPDYLHLNQPVSRLLAAGACLLAAGLPRFSGSQGMSLQTLLQ